MRHNNINAKDIGFLGSVKAGRIGGWVRRPHPEVIRVIGLNVENEPPRLCYTGAPRKEMDNALGFMFDELPPKFLLKLVSGDAWVSFRDYDIDSFAKMCGENALVL